MISMYVDRPVKSDRLYDRVKQSKTITQYLNLFAFGNLRLPLTVNTINVIHNKINSL